jgi:hypothetical protein
MDADTAARIIARDIALGHRVIVVPWQFRVIRSITNFLPRVLLRWVMSRL